MIALERAHLVFEILLHLRARRIGVEQQIAQNAGCDHKESASNARQNLSLRCGH